ncbi:MAG: MBL fold metallo-hydrolase [Desulfobacteraceae bacterium]|nr:MAG: MBL fold metallo-hydrolase [Desulfobacteraceae bacterium]
MTDEILPGLYRIKIPLPESPLKYLNSYVIKSEGRNLIVDTGFNRKECLDAMNNGLSELKIDLADCDYFITHLHADHFGLIARLAVETSRIYFSRPDKEIIESWEGFEPMIEYAGKNGFPENELRTALHQHPGYKYGSDWTPDMSVLEDGETITYGDYSFICVETPGHTLGHICLYEASEKILIAGDHILSDITPNIQCWSDKENPLEKYLSSLDKVRKLDVGLVLPGHRRLFKDHRARIDELKLHHEKRAEEILDILQKGSGSAFEVASFMTWDIRYDSWNDFPVAQKWFATGEAISHLRFLEEKQLVTKGKNDSGIQKYRTI